MQATQHVVLEHDDRFRHRGHHNVFEEVHNDASSVPKNGMPRDIHINRMVL